MRINIPVFLFIFFSIVYFSSSVGTMNSLDASQYSLTKAIVEERRTSIDSFTEYIWPDFAEHKGQKFTEREPGLSLVGIPAYILAKMFTRESNIDVVAYGLSGIYAALSPMLLYLIAKKLKYSEISCIASSIIFGLGTLLWKYSSSYVRQPLASTLILLLILIYILDSKKRNIFFAGLALGLLFITDHLSIIASVIIAVFFIGKYIKQKWQIGFYFCGVTIPIIIFLFYNFASFGSPFSTSRYYSLAPGVEAGRNVFLADLKWTVPLNLFSYGPIPKAALDYLNKPGVPSVLTELGHWASVWNYKGIFIQSPILLLSLVGLTTLKNKKLILMIISVFLSYLLIASKFTNFYNPTAYDTRYLLSAVGILFIGLPAVLDELRKQKKLIKTGGLLIVFVLASISVFNGLIGIAMHFAPHVSGEHRFQFTGNFSTDSKLVFENAFPNLHNLYILIFFVGLGFAISLLLRQFQPRFFQAFQAQNGLELKKTKPIRKKKKNSS